MTEKSELEDHMLPYIQAVTNTLIETFNIVMREQDSKYLDHLAKDLTAMKKIVRVEIDIPGGGITTMSFYEVDLDDGSSKMLFDIHGKGTLQS